jgi:HlyD family secretion protein
MNKYLIIITVILLVAAVAGFIIFKRQPEISYRTVKIERGTLVARVAATGNLSAVVTVQVGTQVSGTIQKLYVDYNSRVKKGQAIAEIDPALFRASVEQAHGNYLNAEANRIKAKIALDDAERTLKRNRKLLSDGILSQGDYDTAETVYQTAIASLKGTEGSVAQTKGSLMLSRTNLNYSVIRSPVDGVVISRAVDVGQTVAASFQTPTLFTIAKDLTKMQIEVSVDEADISRIKLDQNATFTVDSYPEQTFKGKVVQIRSAPVISQNVVTYVVVVNVDNTDLKLKPGMTANVSIEIARRDDCLKLPTAALRFKPKDGKVEEPKEKRVQGQRSMEGGKPGSKENGQRVYILKENKPFAVQIITGIASSLGVEIIEGALKKGDEVIVEQIGGETKKKSGTSPMGARF